MRTELNYLIVIYPVEEGGSVAEVPALKGCIAQGETLGECLKELKKVQKLWLEGAQSNKERIPTAAEVPSKLIA